MVMAAIDAIDGNFITARPMLRVVLSNLIQNAVNYAGQSIHVSIDADSIEIRNSSDVTESQVNENGLGLEIVQRVCDRMGWKFSARQQDDEFVAHVGFRSRNEESK